MSDRANRVLRRLITIPTFTVGFLVGLTSLPFLLPIVTVTDLARGSRLGATRALLFVVYYLGCETVGIVVSGWLWLRFGLTGTRSGPDWLDEHFRLQCWWASMLLAGVRVLFGLRIDVEGSDVVPRGDGPFLLFVRHVSVADTVLAATYLSARRGHRLRYVLKRELLWDPCLDIVGHRLPNCFVERGARISATEIQKIRTLARDLGPSEGVLIYPEGTRFTPQRRASVLARIAASGDTDLLNRSRELEHVLPPRLGGSLALLDECPEADVVFCAHTGFEGTMRLTDLASGSLVGSRVRAAFWRIPAVSIPHDHEARRGWLFERWRELDLWIDARMPPRAS